MSNPDYRKGRADATKDALKVLEETRASIASRGPSSLGDMLITLVDTIAEAIETREAERAKETP